MGIGDWGLGIGDWGLGIGPNPQEKKQKILIKKFELLYLFDITNIIIKLFIFTYF